LPFKVKIGCLQYVADLDYLNMILKCWRIPDSPDSIRFPLISGCVTWRFQPYRWL
jgi:hypothetical protein